MEPFIIGFNFSKLGREKASEFSSFSEKLSYYLTLFQQAYDHALEVKPSAMVIFISHEYAITSLKSPGSRILDYEEHELLKECLKTFTSNNESCMVIFPHAFSKEYGGEEIALKLDKLEERYQESKENISSYTIEERRFQQNQPLYKRAPSPSEMTVVRNVCYLYRDGRVLSKVDKRVPCYEYASYKTEKALPQFNEGNTFFQPGTNRNIIRFNEKNTLAIEICADHAFGLLNKNLRSRHHQVDIHLIVSNSTELNPEHLMGKINIICDALTGMSIVTKGANLGLSGLQAINVTPTFHDGKWGLMIDEVELHDSTKKNSPGSP